MYVTIQDIAEKLDVSPATVSLALSGKKAGKRRLSPATVRRVRRMASKMGYRTNQLAASIRRQQTKTLGFIMRFFHGSYFSDVLRGVNKEVYPEYDLLVAAHNDDPEKERKQLNMMMSKRVDGIIATYSGGPENIQMYKDFVRGKRFPLVMLDTGVPGVSLPVVRCDHFAAVHESTKALIDSGHKRIELVLLEVKEELNTCREQAYLEAMQKAGLSSQARVNPQPHVKGWAREELNAIARRVVKEWISQQQRPTALLITDDYLAYEVLAIAKRDYSLQIPQDLSVMGIGDRSASWMPGIDLSSVSGDYESQGKKAAGLLLDMMDGKKWDGREIVLPISLKMRGTTAAAEQQESGETIPIQGLGRGRDTQKPAVTQLRGYVKE